MAGKTSKKVRLDRLVFDLGIAKSREKARAMILAGDVLVNGSVVDKAGSLVRPDDVLQVKNRMPYVSRGGLKLEHALVEFNLDVRNRTAMDIGASTGGFTDCLLQNGAGKVYSIDVGYGQFDWTLRRKSNVILMEKTNIRHLDRELVPDEIDIAVIDVSFISLLKVIPCVSSFLKPEGEIVALIKPQFEAERKDIGKGGVVRDEMVRLKVIDKIKAKCEETGFEVLGTASSPVKGPKGNVEYLIYLKKR